MMLNLNILLFIVLVITSNISCISGYDDKLTIRVSHQIPVETTYVKKFVLTNGPDKLELNVTRSAFFVVQVHSFIDELILSNDTRFDSHSSIKGNNVGLVQMVDYQNSYDFYLRNNIDNKTVLVAVLVYDKNHPVPGGCNMVFDVENAPYQRVSYTDDMVTVDAQAASMDGYFCEENVVQLEMYHHIFNTADMFTELSYFSAIELSLNINFIRKYWHITPEPQYFSKLRRYYVNYQSRGAVYSVIATYQNYSSLYVPIVSYGCNITDGADSCRPINTSNWNILVVIMIVAAFIIFAAGRVYEPLITFAILFVLGLAFTQTFPSLALLYQILIALAIAAAPIYPIVTFKVTRIVNWALISYIITCNLISSNLGDLVVFQNVWSYWAIFMAVNLLFWLLLLVLGMANKVYVFCADVLAFYFFIIAFMYYVGENSALYVFFNNYKHVTVRNYSYAVVGGTNGQFIGFYCLPFVLLCKIISKCCCGTNRVVENASDENTPLLH